jgi:hypothetical protein
MHMSERQDDLPGKREQSKPYEPRTLPEISHHGLHYTDWSQPGESRLHGSKCLQLRSLYLAATDYRSAIGPLAYRKLRTTAGDTHVAAMPAF